METKVEHSGGLHIVDSIECSGGVYTPIMLVIRNKRRRLGASQVVLVVKNLPANAGDIRDMG